MSQNRNRKTGLSAVSRTARALGLCALAVAGAAAAPGNDGTPFADRFLNAPHFSFKCGDVRLNGFEPETVREVKGLPEASLGGERKYEVTYTFANGIRIREELTVYDAFKAVRTLLHFENTADANSGQLSEIYDCDVSFPFNENYAGTAPGHRTVPENKARVFRSVGSNWVRDEFFEYAEFIAPHERRSYACRDGRSSNGLMPYFDLNENGRGVLVAIGWSGQWNAHFEGRGKEINVRTGIEGVNFYLEPQESIRTSSAVIMLYDDGRDNAANQWRRFFMRHVTNMGKGQRPAELPLSVFGWGSISSEKMVERITKITRHGMGAEHYWIDAGWYGYSTGPCPTEFVGDWHAHTGSWVVNKTYHPDGLTDVVKAIKDNGLGLTLWLEPERVLRGTDTPKEHPGWFMELAPDNNVLLIDYSKPEAVQGTYEMLAGYIEKFNIKCYRQDFNTDPLHFWRKHDAEDRRGIKEIKCVMGLYRLWDMLLARFPELFIDNCASGGRRNDIELMSRSVPLWRSDYQCTFDYEPEVAQIHHTGIARWLPYHGTAFSLYDVDAYTCRSAYSPSVLVRYWGYEDGAFDEQDGKTAAAKKYMLEYKSVRPYLTCDYYPLVKNTLCDTSWCAWQFNRPENGDGIILAFRRPDSPMSQAAFDLKGLAEGKYTFTDADTGEEVVMAHDEINARGFKVEINEKRASRLIRYRKM